jgi:hypothetical protein
MHREYEDAGHWSIRYRQTVTERPLGSNLGFEETLYSQCTMFQVATQRSVSESTPAGDGVVEIGSAELTLASGQIPPDPEAELIVNPQPSRTIDENSPTRPMPARLNKRSLSIVLVRTY